MKKSAIILVTLIVLYSVVSLVACDTTHTIVLDSDGGSKVENISVTGGEVANAPLAPTRDSHVFVGWYLGDEKYDFSKIVTSDVTLVAKWVKTIKSLYDNNSDQFEIIWGSLLGKIEYSNDSQQLYDMELSGALDVIFFARIWHSTCNRL